MNTQHLQVLIGLIAQKSVPQQNCLSDEQLIDFINGDLKGHALRQVQQHLHACPDCYREWQQTCDLMDIAPQMTVERKTHWAEKLTDLLTIKPIFITASALASIIAIILFLPIFYQTPLQQQIDQSFQQLQAALPTENISHKTASVNEEISGFGFGFANMAQPTIQQLAFQQGVRAAQGQYENIQQVADKKYYELGRWIVLLQQTSELETDLSMQFWQQQKLILEKFKQDLIDDKLVSQHLEKLDNILQQLPSSEKFDLYDKLYRYAGFIQQDLAP